MDSIQCQISPLPSPNVPIPKCFPQNHGPACTFVYFRPICRASFHPPFWPYIFWHKMRWNLKPGLSQSRWSSAWPLQQIVGPIKSRKHRRDMLTRPMLSPFLFHFCFCPHWWEGLWSIPYPIRPFVGIGDSIWGQRGGMRGNGKAIRLDCLRQNV